MNTTQINIKEKLKCLEFEYAKLECSSIYFTDDIQKIENLHPKIFLDLVKAKEFQADAVYFRFFDNRLPVPQIYIYDNTNNLKSVANISKIHKEIWSSSEIPIFIIISKSSINIYDGRSPIKSINNEDVSEPFKQINLEELALYDDVIKEYNAQNFNNGVFWEKTDNKHFVYSNSAYVCLLNGLREVRKGFQKENPMYEKEVDKILILFLLIKFLEENGIDDSGENLAGNFFLESSGYSSFTDILRENRLSDLIIKLAGHFNGGIFNLSAKEKQFITKGNFDILIEFLEGKLTINNELFLWSMYSFKHIPIELISNIYEEFLPKEKRKKDDDKEKKKDTSAVYTPKYLVDFLVDECLPISRSDLNFNTKILDTSCGSGIFLVVAYKRLIQRWVFWNKYYNASKNELSPQILKDILKNNIFGIDHDETAPNLTIFSLNLTLCSQLTPKQIWTELSFDDLKKEKNIVKQDFFDFFIENQEHNFDLVIGNPPFKALNKNVYKQYSTKLREAKKPFICDIPDNQLSLMFLDKASELLKPKGLLCMIQPSGPLLYNNSAKNIEFRKKFFDTYNIPQIIDFSFLRNILFKSANVTVSAIFVQKIEPNSDDITHVVINKNKSVREKIYFEIDYYDFHNVPKSLSWDNAIWKCNLIGGYRVYNLINDIKDKYQTTFEDYLKQQKELHGWSYGQGYKIGNKQNEDSNSIIYKKSSVIDKYFNEKGIQKTEIQEERYFETIPSDKNIFAPPHLLIKKTVGINKLHFEMRNDYLTFKNEVIGIHCNPNDYNELVALENLLKRYGDIYRFIIIASSARFGIQRTPYTILLKDYLELPFFDSIKLRVSDQIIVDDVLKHYLDYWAKTNGNLMFQVSDENAIHEYSDIFLKSLNSVYKVNESSYYLKSIIFGLSFTMCVFEYADEIKPSFVEKRPENIDSLLDGKYARNVLIKRVVKIYQKNRIILIKPNQLKYWLKSIALRDADDCLNDSLANVTLQAENDDL